MNLPAISGPRLLHYSQKPNLLRPLQSYEQRSPYGDATGYKPSGLWLSVEGDDDWKSWCLAEKFRLGNLRHTHEVILKPNANIIHISTAEELDKFDDLYRASSAMHAILADVGAHRALIYSTISASSRNRMFGIDWRKVAQEYQGIIIAPYLWERRLDGDTFWYYTWDCASGCIWDRSAIAEIRLTNERAVTQMQITREIHGRMNNRRRKKLWAKFYAGRQTAKSSLGGGA